jgi:dTDP-4-dehydrorhamnose 3,5-epimerase
MSAAVRYGPVEGATTKGLSRLPDERGFFEEIIRASDPFFNGFAQFSWCRRREGTITAWHIHPNQWDWWFVPHGVMKAVLHDLRLGSSTRGNTLEVYLGEDVGDKVLAIPNGVAHGYKVIGGPMELFYVTSREYNLEHPGPPDGEEGRMAHDDPSIGYDWHGSSPIR